MGRRRQRELEMSVAETLGEGIVGAQWVWVRCETQVSARRATKWVAPEARIPDTRIPDSRIRDSRIPVGLRALRASGECPASLKIGGPRL